MSFQTAAAAIKASGSSNVKMSEDELLQIYSLYKQGEVGDVNTARPGLADFKGKAKWDAWEKQKGKSKDQAQKEYVELARNLLKKYNQNPTFWFLIIHT